LISIEYSAKVKMSKKKNFDWSFFFTMFEELSMNRRCYSEGMKSDYFEMIYEVKKLKKKFDWVGLFFYNV